MLLFSPNGGLFSTNQPNNVILYRQMGLGWNPLRLCQSWKWRNSWRSLITLFSEAYHTSEFKFSFENSIQVSACKLYFRCQQQQVMSFESLYLSDIHCAKAWFSGPVKYLRSLNIFPSHFYGHLLIRVDLKTA